MKKELKMFWVRRSCKPTNTILFAESVKEANEKVEKAFGKCGFIGSKEFKDEDLPNFKITFENEMDLKT